MSEPEYEDFVDQEKATAEWAEKLLGKVHVFDDGDKLEIVQVKRRDTGPWVTYHVYQGPGIPRKMVMQVDEFDVTYGHLFGLRDIED